MSTNKECLLNAIVASEEEHLIKLSGDLAMVQGLGGIGPGVISRTDYIGIYKITQSVTMNQTPLVMEFMFAAEDVLWLSPAPQAPGPAIFTNDQGGGLNIGRS